VIELEIDRNTNGDSHTQTAETDRDSRQRRQWELQGRDIKTKRHTNSDSHRQAETQIETADTNRRTYRNRHSEM